MRQLLLILCGSILIFGCAKKVTTSGSAGGAGKYSEDLSVWRPEIEKTVDSTAVAPGTAPERVRTNQYVAARFAVTDEVDVILDSIHDQNIDKGYIDGYTIQVYSGIKREDALSIKKKISMALPELDSDVQYRQPNFRVRAGKYLSRLEAQKDYLDVKQHFPNAIVIPDRIEVE